MTTQLQRGLGGALLQQWHLWLVDLSICEMVRRVVVSTVGLSGQ
jgi:hypothetical protein